MSETGCTTSVAWLEDVCLCFQTTTKNQQVYLITSRLAVSSLSRVYFKHVSSMTSELSEAGILDAGDHLTLLQVSPVYFGCGSK